jgi:glyoxylate/hydroxypyruvate reductase A
VTVALLFYSQDDDPEAWGTALRALLPELDLRLWPEMGDRREIEAALVWLPPPGLLASLPGLRAIFSLGAGVDAMLRQEDLPDVPLCRLVDPSLTRTMAEFVLTQILYYHRDLDLYAAQQQAARWRLRLPQAASSRTIGVMGLGELGGATARLLAGHGFEVLGWSRSQRTIDGVEAFAGNAGLAPFLARAGMLVCLLPLTAETEGLLDAALFAQLPQGAVLVHVGRGRQLVPGDLMAALDTGQLRGAAIDVTPVEPLPADDPLWRHPGVRLTPHVASYAQPATAAETVVENLLRLRRGEPLLAVVDRNRGY